MKRAHGTGAIVYTRGQYLPRLPLALGRKPLPPQPTYEAAERLLNAAIADLQDRAILPTDIGETWATMAQRWYRARCNPGLRRSYGEAVVRVSREPWARMPIDVVTRKDLLAWIDGRNVSRRYSRATTLLDLAVVKLVFGFSLDRETTLTDPTVRVRIPKGWEKRDTWTYLSFDELRAILSCGAIALKDRAIVALFVGTGLRKREWMSLRMVDVREDGVCVRIGTEAHGVAGPPKGKRAAVVPLLPLASTAWRVWLHELPQHARSKPNSTRTWRKAT